MAWTIKEPIFAGALILLALAALFRDETNSAGGGRRSLIQLGIFRDPKTIINLRPQPPLDDYADYDLAAAEMAAAPNEVVMSSQPLPRYTLEDALNESTVFESIFCILVYDPPTDKFIVLFSKDHLWRHGGNEKLFRAMNQFTFMLRHTFPKRFSPSWPELVIPIGSGDYPHVIPSKLPHVGRVAPVLTLGTALRDTALYPNMIAMPMPEKHHLGCFVKWIEDKSEVCDSLQPGSLVFGEEYGLEWNSLIPQVIWRGTDFGYLDTLLPFSRLQKPSHTKTKKSFFRKLSGKEEDKRTNTIHALNEQIDTLLPRWKGVALTADAELKAQGTDSLPWANIKFSSYNDPIAGKSPTIGSDMYASWEEVGIATGEGMSLSDLAKYKYHIDLGSGGGTSWSGTILKLAMPGLLFHHVTPTKDYIHDHIKAWKHFIPVSDNLKDLKQKFDWAESHPVEAKRIADAGTEFMRQLGTPDGFGKLFEQSFVDPVRRVIEAYRPVSSVHTENGMSSWRDVLESLGDSNSVIPVMECTGIADNTCQLVVGEDEIKTWNDRAKSRTWKLGRSS
ncbi:hypothetical protein ACHAXR_004558 [Thalassiosira sp. AJA248-18]